MIWAVVVLLAGCGRSSLDPKAKAEAHNILSGKTYASEGAGHDILLAELARKARGGEPTDEFLAAAAARDKITWTADWLTFQLANRRDFRRPGFGLSGSPRMQALGPLGLVAGDFQELAQATTSKAPEEVSRPVREFFRGHFLEGLPQPLYFYTIAYHNRDLATEEAFARAVSQPMELWGGRMVAEGFFRMRPFGQRHASEQQATSLALLQVSKPRTAALMYLAWPTAHKGDIPWEKNAIKKGLAELSQRYPNSLYIHTRQLELDPDPEGRKKLGHRWERTPALPPENRFGGWSDLPACEVGLERQQLSFPPERGENLRCQVTDLLLRGQYQTLEALFAELRQGRDPRLELAYWGCLGTEENAKACTMAVSNWVEVDPGSPVAPVAAAMQSLTKPETREWVAGRQAQSADQVLKSGNLDGPAVACLVAIRLSQGQGWEKQVPTVFNSLKQDFLQDRSLETLVDNLKDPSSRQQLADQLKQQSGSDAAYCRIATRGSAWSEVDPKRFLESLKAVKARPGYAPVWAVDMLFQLSRWDRREEARLLLPLCDSLEYLPPDRHPGVFALVKRWAQGEGANPWIEPKIKVGASYSRFVDVPAFAGEIPARQNRIEGNTLPPEPNREMGFDLSFDRPIVREHHWKVLLTHPASGRPEGLHTQCQRDYLVTPDDSQTLFIGCGLRENMTFEGRWELTVRDADSRQVIATRSFNVQF